MASLLTDPLLEISGRGPAPNQNFYHFSITKADVIWRWWKISPRAVDRRSRPGEVKQSHQDFLDDTQLHSEVHMIFGLQILEYAKALCQGHYDYLGHLSDSLLLRIINYLELEDVGQLGQTSRRFRKLCGSEEFWEQAVRRRCNTVSAEVASLALEMGWRTIFFTSKLQLQKLMRRRRLKTEAQPEGQASDSDTEEESSDESLEINQASCSEEETHHDICNLKLDTDTDANFEEVMKGKVQEGVREFLKSKPFTEYQTGPFFDKFLQWKEYEKQPINDKYFYEFRTLGKGGFGEVCAVQVKNTGQMYACKKLCKKRLKKKRGEKMALLEKKILEKVNSLFLVNLAYAYDNKTHLCLVMTLMNGGDLKYHIYNIGYDGKGVDKGIEMKRIIHYTAQISTGILHLHAMNIIYRDMKPENVLLDSQGQCRLSDLGLAIEIAPEKTVTQMAGTGAYMAPEILNKTPYRTSVDWWALGCSIYEMVAGYTPFKGPESKKEKVEKEEVQRRIQNEEPKWEHKCFDAVTKDIIQQFLKKKIDERLGMKNNMEDPRKHEWFKTINFPRLEAGLVDPPWVPKPNVVYAKDTGDIAEFSEIKGIEFDANDEKFFREFSTGAVPIQWQQEMIDTGLFDELNDPNRKEGAGGLDDDKKSGTCTVL